MSDLSSDIMNDTIDFYSNRMEKVALLKPVGEKGESCKVSGHGGRCVIQHVSKEGDTDVHVVTHFQQHKDNIAAWTEVVLTVPTTFVPRETLAHMVPILNTKLGCESNSSWTIEYQPSIFEVMEPDWSTVDSVTAAQKEKDCQFASIELLILAKHRLLKNHKRLGHSTTENMTNLMSVEVWSYGDINFQLQVKSLFINGYLSSTTSPTGNAHANALVHLAMVAHPSPARAAVISLTSNAIVKEVLNTSPSIMFQWWVWMWPH